MKFSIDIDPKMEPIIAARLPGFYVDARGAYGIVFRDYYICCFINSDDGSYDVTVDTISDEGDFDKTSYGTAMTTPMRPLLTCAIG